MHVDVLMSSASCHCSIRRVYLLWGMRSGTKGSHCFFLNIYGFEKPLKLWPLRQHPSYGMNIVRVNFQSDESWAVYASFLALKHTPVTAWRFSLARNIMRTTDLRRISRTTVLYTSYKTPVRRTSLPSIATSSQQANCTVVAWSSEPAPLCSLVVLVVLRTRSTWTVERTNGDISPSRTTTKEI